MYSRHTLQLSNSSSSLSFRDCPHEPCILAHRRQSCGFRKVCDQFFLTTMSNVQHFLPLHLVNLSSCAIRQSNILKPANIVQVEHEKAERSSIENLTRTVQRLLPLLLVNLLPGAHAPLARVTTLKSANIVLMDFETAEHADSLHPG